MKALTNFFDRIVQRYLPDAFLFAIVLTFIVFLLGIFITHCSPLEMTKYWGDGCWDLLEFAMQMSLIVVTIYILANTPTVKKELVKASLLANNPGQAIILSRMVASISTLI